MRYLISNITGVVGRYLVKELIENPVQYQVEQIVGLSRQHRYFYDEHPSRQNAILLECYGDLRYNTIRLTSQFKPDIILHTAGDARQNSPTKDLWRANVDTTLNLLESCKVLEKVKFVYCSSIVTELSPLNLYGASKLAGEALVQSYSKDNLQGFVFRFPAVAGAGNKHGVVKDIVRKVLDDSSDIELFGEEPGSIKPFVYAGELACNILKLILPDKYNNYKLYKLGSGDNISVLNIAQIVMEMTKKYKNITWNPSKVWKEDSNNVLGVNSIYRMSNANHAIIRAVDDILKEDYGYAV